MAEAPPEALANPEAPFLAFVGLLYLFLSPALLLSRTPHTGILSFSMFAFGACTTYLAFKPYNLGCRIMTMAWGSTMTIVALSALLMAGLTGDITGMIASLVALLLTSPVVLLAVRERPVKAKCEQHDAPKSAQGRFANGTTTARTG